jgi:lipopolysaccharide transport system ATP-binding protein
MTEYAIRANGLGKRYRLGQVENAFARLVRRWRHEPGAGHMWALRDLTFDVEEGEAVAIIGRNGAGKSTLLKLLARVTEPTEGYADLAGRVGALLEVGTGFSGELTGRENVYLNGAILGMQRAEVDGKFDQIVEFSGVERHIDTPVKWYSSGMYIRLAFAVAAHLEPEVLIIDEVLAVGDAEFQKRCFSRMSDVVNEGRTVLFVSHNMQAVRRLCRRGILLEQGRMLTDGPVEDVIRTYLASIETEDAGVRRWPSGQGPGDDECRIVEVRVTGADGEPKSTHFTSKPFYITVEFDLAQPNPLLNGAIELSTMDGVIVLMSSFRDVAEDRMLQLVAGRNALRCEVPAGLLNSGRFIINLRFSLTHVRFIAYEDAVLHFDVLADHGESLFAVAAGRSGVVAPLLDWTTVEPAAADEERVALHASG